MRYEATVATAKASAYLQQLCKHWSHKFVVTYDAAHGMIALSGASCTLDATGDRLVIALESDAADAFPRMCDVVGEHLQRFAARETLAITWYPAT